MMKPKFRMRDTRNNEMIDYSKIIFNSSNNLFGGLFELFRREEFVAMQYVGVKDRRGNEIYEGDILIVGDIEHLPNEVICRADKGYVTYVEVIFTYGTFGMKNGGHLQHWRGLNGGRTFEIVGNIYENTDLLSKVNGNAEENTENIIGE